MEKIGVYQAEFTSPTKNKPLFWPQVSLMTSQRANPKDCIIWTLKQEAQARKPKKDIMYPERKVRLRRFDLALSVCPSLPQESHSGKLQGDRCDCETRAQGDRVPAGDRTGSPGKRKRHSKSLSVGLTEQSPEFNTLPTQNRGSPFID